MEIDELLTTLREGHETVLSLAGKEGDRKITVNLRKLHPEEPREPVRQESPPRRHVFLTAKSFAAYLLAYGTPDTVVYADPVGELMHAVLDETAENGFEIVFMQPAIHPLWKPWADLSGKRLDVREFAAFVSQNRRTITKPEGRDIAHTYAQIRAAVEIEAQHGRGKDAVNGVMVKTKIQGVESKGFVELHEEITLTVPLYVATDPVTFEVDLCLEAERDGKVFVLVTAGTVAEARVKAFQGMCDEVTKALPDRTVTFGRPAHAEWKYLPELAPSPKASS